MQAVSHDSISQMEREESEFEKSMSLVEKHLQQLDFLAKNGSNQHVFLLLHRLLSGAKHLGTIRLKKEPCATIFNPLKHMEAQEISVQSKPPNSFKFGYRLDRIFDQVSGMVVDKDDNLILADESFLQMYSKDGKYVKECKLKGDAWDISYHKQSGRIVVALRNNGIQFVNNFTAQTKISVQNIKRCLGVRWVDDSVYVSGYDSNRQGRINILDSNGKHINSISSISSVGRVYYIHHRDNTIYYTDSYKVYCIKKDESKVFTFSSPDLRGAYGIDSDRQGNVYVVGRKSNMLRLSSDGQNSDIIMKKGDGINHPITLCFSRDFKKLFVPNERGKLVVVYNCEY